MVRASSSMALRPGVDLKDIGMESIHTDTLSSFIRWELVGHITPDFASPLWCRFLEPQKALLISKALSHAYGPSESWVNWVNSNQKIGRPQLWNSNGWMAEMQRRVWTMTSKQIQQLFFGCFSSSFAHGQRRNSKTFSAFVRKTFDRSRACDIVRFFYTCLYIYTYIFIACDFILHCYKTGKWKCIYLHAVSCMLRWNLCTVLCLGHMDSSKAVYRNHINLNVHGFSSVPVLAEVATPSPMSLAIVWMAFLAPGSAERAQIRIF